MRRVAPVIPRSGALGSRDQPSGLPLYSTTSLICTTLGASVAHHRERNFSISGQDLGESSVRSGGWVLVCIACTIISRATLAVDGLMMDAVSKPWRIHSGPVSGLQTEPR